MPSKHTAIGLLVGILSLFLGIGAWIFSGNHGEMQGSVKDDIKQAINEIKSQGRKEDRYVKRYLKRRLAEIEKVEILRTNNLFAARIYYFSYWYKLTSNFRASVEIRHIKDLNKKYDEEEGWVKAHLLNHTDTENHIIYLGETEYIHIGGLENGEVYEVRVADYSYDSDEPPTLPFRFQMK